MRSLYYYAYMGHTRGGGFVWSFLERKSLSSLILDLDF